MRRALALYLVLAGLIAGPTLIGDRALGPEAVLDEDPLYRKSAGRVVEPFNDATLAELDLPRDFTIARALRAGRFDSWNANAGAGAPLWAEQGSPFFPLKWIFYARPSRRTYNLFLALRLVLGALGAYCLARRRLSDGAALVAGALFELSGPSVGYLAFGSTSPIYMLPWVLWGVDSIATRAGPRAAVVAAIALGLAGVGGQPMLVLTIFFAFGVALVTAIAWSAERRRMATWGLAALGLGLALAAPALLPLGELSMNAFSYKRTAANAAVMDDALKTYGGLLPSALFAPAYLVSLRPLIGHTFPHAFAPAVGALGLCLGLLGLSSSPLSRPLLVTGLAGCVAALGGLLHFPVTRWVMPYYFWPLASLPMAIAAGGGIDRLARAGAGRLTLKIVLSLVGCALLLAVFSDPMASGELGGLSRLALRTPAGALRLLGPWAVAIAALAISSLGGMRSWKRRLIGVLAVAELGLTMRGVLRDPASGVLDGPPSPAVDFLRRDLDPSVGRLVAVPKRVGRPQSTMLFGLPDLRAIGPLPLERLITYKLLFDSSEQRFATAAQRPDEFPTYHTYEKLRSPFFDLASVTHLITQRVGDRPAPSILEGDPALPLLYQDTEVAIYRNLAALPRARIVHRAEALDGPAAVARLARHGSETRHAAPLGLADTTLLEASLVESLPGGPASRRERATILPGDDPDHVRIDANLERPGWVLLADAYYPGWRATIDDRPTAVYPADVLFRAVAVPAGRHTVEFIYRPLPLYFGLGIAGLALLLCISLWRSGAKAAAPSSSTPTR